MFTRSQLWSADSGRLWHGQRVPCFILLCLITSLLIVFVTRIDLIRCGVWTFLRSRCIYNLLRVCLLPLLWILLKVLYSYFFSWISLAARQLQRHGHRLSLIIIQKLYLWLTATTIAILQVLHIFLIIIKLNPVFLFFFIITLLSLALSLRNVLKLMTESDTTLSLTTFVVISLSTRWFK